MSGRALLGWLEEPDEHRGIRTLRPDGTWSFVSYCAAAGMVGAMAARLRERGVTRDDRVVVAVDSPPDFVASLFGALAVGAVPVPMALPARFQDPLAYRERAAGILRVARPACLIADPALATRLEPDGLDQLIRTVIVVDPNVPAREGCDRVDLVPGEQALLQFTSGSSGSPKGIAVSRAELTANIASIQRWLGMTVDDPTATWLPLHHDMGLVGCLLTPIVTGGDLWITRPADFVRSPLPWLTALGRFGARLSAVPAFGLAYVARKVRPESLDGLDFSQWRALIVGAERIDPAVLDGFHRVLSGHGFSRRAFLPAYGLAEATLAVTGVALADQPRVVHVERGALTPGSPLAVAPAAGQNTVSLVGCGRPLGGAAVAILDEDGAPAPEGHLGEIEVSGPSVAGGGSLRTGDLGALLDGELFVVGRGGDSVKRRARTVFAEDLESLAGTVPELAGTRPIVLLGNLRGVDTAVLVVTRRPGPWIGPVVDILRAHTEDMPVLVCLDPRGCEPRTSSGKPRRRPLWNALLRGEITATQVQYLDDHV